MMNTAAANRPGSLAYVYLLTLVAALGGLLFGYDTAVISGAIGFLQTHFTLDAQFGKGWAAASALVGCALGAGLAGMLSDWLGRKRILTLAALLFLISALGTAFPREFWQFVLFRVVGGVGIGAASIASPMYIAEISPARIRGRMVSLNQFAIVSGILVVYFVNYFIAAWGTHVDRQLSAARLGERPAVLDAQFAKSFLLLHWPDEAGVAEFLQQQEGQPGAPDSRSVAGVLAKHGVAIDASAVEAASLGVEPWNENRGWRWMFGSGILPSLCFLVLLMLVPESPRWLTEKGREDEALAVLQRVGGSQQAAVELADIREAIGHESGSLAQLFEPGMRMVLVIGVTLAVLQQVTGINVFLYFAPEIFKKIGSGVDVALFQTVLVGAVNLAFTIVAIWTVDRLGRKPLLLIGASGMGLSLVAWGLAFYFQRTELWVLVFVIGYIACFALSVGPVVWVVLSEIFPTRIRGRAMALATVCLWAANYVVTQTFTFMDESPWLVDRFHHAFPFWVYAALCGVTVLFVWRYVPETKGKTLEEIERSWHCSPLPSRERGRG
ncbi:MAG: sugar porter family MFS transporter [Thermoguttaceae bacterium]|jgi:MFS family permease